MAKKEHTSNRVATEASKTLHSPSASKTAKSLAGSVLAQSHTSKDTSAKVASKAAKALNDGRTSKTTKSIAGSALTQKKK
jgi:hypothetical protein